MTRIRHSRIGQSDRSQLFLLTAIAIFVLVAVGGLAVALFSSARGASATPPPPGALVLTYDSSKAGCPTDGSIALPFEGTLDGDVTWGDGTTNTWTGGNNPSHTYAAAGKFNIAVTGTASHFGAGETSWIGAPCITSVVQWGELGLTSLSGALSGATNVTSVPDWIPAAVTDISFMFDGATSFNGRIATWNTAAVTTLEGTFRGATSFNQPLNTWNTLAVTNMAETFSGASAFNRPITNWRTSSVSTFRAMFKNAKAFNQAIIITPNNANDASEMFRGASAFNQYFTMWGGGAIYGTTLKGMFRDATSFNQRVDWNTNGVTDMSDMFRGATAFNGYVGSLPMSTVTDASHMFDGATSFNGDLTAWQTGSFLSTNSMFRNATSFSQSIGNLNTANVTDMSHMFEGATSFTGGVSGLRSVNDFNTTSAVTMNSMFKGATNFNAGIWNWDVSHVTDAGSMFAGATLFDQSLSNWNVGSLTNMANMFDGASNFGRGNSGVGGVGNWNVSNVTNMTSAFANTTYFNEDLSNWSMTSLNRALGVLAYARAFDQSLAVWDTTHLLNGDGIGIEYSGISTTNYSKTLAGWGRQAQPTRPANSIRLNANDKTFDRLWEQSRRFSLTSKGWDIRDAGRAAAQTPLSMSYDFTSALSSDTTIADGGVTVYLPLTGYSRLSVNWGDGSSETFSTSAPISHFYSMIAGDPELNTSYTVTVTGQAAAFDSRVHDGQGMPYISAIGSWGQLGLTSLNYALSNLTGLNTAVPAIPSTVRSVAHMYDGLVSASAASGVIAPSKTWVMSNVIDMSSMFENSNITISDISRWNVSGVTDMSSMFAGIPAGPHPSIAALDLSDWDVSNVQNMTSMFQGSNFNGSINDWDVSNVRSMAGMFAGNAAFNQPLSTWDTGRVVSFASMFEIATAFNQPLAGWNIRSAVVVHAMFSGATAFNQPLGTWYVNDSLDMAHMLDFSGISVANLGETLDGFRQNSPGRWVTLGAAGLSYDSRGEIARTHLVNDRSWTIDHDFSTPAGAPMTLTYDNLSTACGQDWINLPYANNYGLTVNWGDGTADGHQYFGPGESLWHHFDQPGAYDIKVYGIAERFGYDNWYGVNCITAVGSYGDLGLTDLSSAWSFSNHLTSLPTLPARVTNLSRMFANASDFNLNISGWDTSGVTSMYQMFVSASSFNQNLSGWNTANVTNMAEMFSAAYAFTGNVSTWDTSRVASMERMFSGDRAFNSPVGSWDVSHVIDMTSMFAGAESFNQPIGTWKTSSLTSMTGMFAGASSFNQSLAGWDTSHVTSLAEVFSSATGFNGDISTWDTSSVTDFTRTFYYAGAFNSPIGNWDVTQSTNFTSMFQSSGFNQPIGSWTMQSAQSLVSMFQGALQFNQDLLGWKTTNVTDTRDMFSGASSFNGDISTWDLRNDQVLDRMFQNATAFNGNISSWDIHVACCVRNMFQGASSFNQDLTNWHLDSAYAINAMFYGAYAFNQSLGKWHLPAMTEAFDGFSQSGMSARNYTDTLIGWADQVDQGLMRTSVSLRTDLAYYPEAQNSVDYLRSRGWWIQDGGVYSTSPMTMVWDPAGTSCNESSLTLALGGMTTDGSIDWGDGSTTPVTAAGTFTHSFSGTDVRTISVSGQISTFGNGTALAGGPCMTSVGQWGNLTLTAMPGAFRGWSNLVSVPSSSPGAIRDFSNTFRDASKFTGSLNWFLSNAQTTSHMFDGATSFTGGLNGWDVSNVVDMSYMFAGATSFTQSVGSWNPYSVRNLSHMFDGATSFLGSFENWNTQSVTDMSYMFRNATSQNYDFSLWNVSNVRDMTAMFDGSALTTHNYDSILNGWASRPVQRSVTLGSLGRQYRSNALASRTRLISNFGWTIHDDGPVAEAPMVLTFDTSLDGCDPNIWLPLQGVLGATLNWGDGTDPIQLTWDYPDHHFEPGVYQVTIDGEADHFGYSNWRGNGCLKSVSSFGELGMTRLDDAFSYAGNLISVPTALPTTIRTTARMFQNSSKLNQDLSKWDTSRVADMSGMFNGATSFNGNVSTWETSRVTNMDHMFSSASAFNQDVSKWNVSNVTAMGGMFAYTAKFDGDLSAWDVRKVTSTNSMFAGATAFTGDLAKWNLAKATDLGYMFYAATAWDHSFSDVQLPSMTGAWEIFSASGITTRHYSDTLKGWATKVVAGQMLPNVGLRSVTNYFADAADARQTLIDSGWIIQDYGAYDLTPMTIAWSPKSTSCGSSSVDLALGGNGFYGTIDWGDGSTPTAAVVGINSHTYSDTDEHTIQISGNIPTFGNGNALRGGSCLTSVGQWGNLRLTAMPGAFRGWSHLSWVPRESPGAVSDFSNTFRDAKSFNADLFWDTSAARNASHMFDGAKSFNGWSDSWNLGNVSDASYMFAGASNFNRYANNWGLSIATDVSHMFEGATSFAQNIGSWSVGNVQNMTHMFDGATNFGCQVSSWNTSRVTDMAYMFRGDRGCDQNLSALDISSVTTMTAMFDGSSLSTFNYNFILNGWGSQSTQKNVTFGVPGVRYRPTAAAAHDRLVNDQKWIITDGAVAPYSAMRFTLDTNAPGCYPNVNIPIHGIRDITVDWGDGTSTHEETGWDWAYHDYSNEPGKYQVSIVGDASVFGQNGGWNGNTCLTSVESFGDLGLTTLADAFYGAYNLQSVPNSLPATVTDTSRMFYSAGSFNADMKGWDTSHVTAMREMFTNASSFNGDISTWDTSHVTDMGSMFYNAVSFNGDISRWDTAQVADTSAMFSYARVFNQNIGSWDLGNVVDMNSMFEQAWAFNQDLSAWDVHNVHYMANVFRSARAFNGDISTWDVRNVEYMPRMFESAYSFNGDISKWNLASATDLNYMFNSAYSWNQSLVGIKLPKIVASYESLWAVSMSARNYSDTVIYFAAEVAAGRMPTSVTFTTTMQYFADAVPAHDALIAAGWTLQDLGVYDMTPMTMTWDPVGTACGTNQLDLAFSGPNLTGTIDWGDGSTPQTVTSGVNSHTYSDSDAHTVQVSGQISTFGNGQALRSGPCMTTVGQWGNLRLTAMPGAFRGWSHLLWVPQGSPGAIRDFSNTFRDATTFNEELYWDMSSARTTSHMFDGAKSFNGWTDGWYLYNVTDASYMFANASNFNRYMNNSLLTSATDLSYMFAGAKSFGQSLVNWQTGNVRNMAHMFDGATNFNGQVTTWDTSHVTDMSFMFSGDRSFDQNVGSFNVSSVQNMAGMFNGSGLSTVTYNSILSSWGASATQKNVSLGAAGIRYRPIASDAHDHLVNDQGWNIADGGLAPYSAMKLTIDTSIGNCTLLQLPIYGVRGLTVDWGDGLSEPQGDGAWHNYPAQSGTYQISLTGDATAFGQNGGWQGNGCLTSVDSFGDLGIRSMDSAFYRASNLTTVPNSLPVTVTDTSRMFAFAGSFNGDLSGWDISHVTALSAMFDNAASFNGDISKWDTSHVTDMPYMFNNAVSFNGDISAWDTSQAVSTAAMFANAHSFNQKIGSWDLGNVVDMSSMFEEAWAFNQDLSDWDVHNVQYMAQVFRFASAFNGDISTWDVRKVVTTTRMFQGAVLFNGDISKWDMASVTDVTFMFYAASSWNHTLVGVKLPVVRSAFQSLWGVPVSARNYSDTLNYFASEVAAGRMQTNVQFSTTLQYFADALPARNALIAAGWALEDYGLYDLTPMTLHWDPSSTTCGTDTLELALSGDGMYGFIDWGDGSAPQVAVSGINSHTYTDTDAHDVAISGQVPTFGNGNALRGGPCMTWVSQWGNVRLTAMPGAFRGWSHLAWVPQSSPGPITDFSNTFRDAMTFNTDFYQWELGYATTTSHMFDGAKSFNGWMDTWNMGNVVDASYMFANTSTFDRDLRSWNVSKLRNMSHMFDGASNSFVRIANWNTSSVTDMSYAFANTPKFDRDISLLNVTSVTNMTGMLNDSAFTTYFYDLALNAWSAQNVKSNVTLGAVGRPYRLNAAEARTHLVTDKGWTIVDDGPAPESPMQLTIDTNAPGCDPNVTLPFHDVRDLTIDWGDGSDPEHRVFGADFPTHTYGSGVFHVSATGEAYAFGQWGGWRGSGCLTSVESFGGLGTTSLNAAFWATGNLVSVPTSLPASVIDTSGMFFYDSAFNQDLSGWDTSHVTNMAYMFAYANSFAHDIGGWNTARVTNMAYMFDHATSFNSDLSTWNTSNVTNMSRMFNSAVSFNGDIHTWNTSKVTLMSGMFADAQAFNGAIGEWNTSRVTSTEYMFDHAKLFNQDINNWNTSKLVNAGLMFQNASAFNQPLNSWNVSSLTSMYSMFLWAGSFNQDLSSWDVHNLNWASYAFFGSAFNHSLATWHLENLRSAVDLLSVTPMSPSNFADSIRGWAAWPATVRGLDYMSSNIRYSPSGQDAHQYLTDTLGWRLYDAGPTSKQPMTINVDTSLDACETTAITLPIGGVITDDPVVDWGDGTVERLNSTSVPTHTYGAVGQYNVNVAGVFSHFGNTAGYVGANCITGISGWGETGVTDLSGAFKGATNLATLPTLPGAVTNLSSAFANNATFNLDMSVWDVSRVTNFSNMFAGSTAFNSDITGWNTSAATNMNGMFSGASSFNQDISVWDVSNVLSMNGMFNGATSFDQSLAAWHLKSVTSMADSFALSAISEDNWTATLIGWGSDAETAHDVAIDASNHTWLVAAAAAHSNLVSTLGWTFTNDGGLVDIPVITAVPSGVHGDQNVLVSWRALTDAEKVGADIDQIVVAAFDGVGTEISTCSPVTLTSLSCDVTGLNNGTAYTFKLKAHNRIGWSEFSSASAPVTPSTVTSPPSIASATRGNAQVTVTWNAPANNGGAPILGYTVTAYAGGTLVAGKSCSPTPATGLTCDVTGLTNGTAYTFKVVASNLNGPSALSNASSPVTPASAPTAPAAPTVTRGDAKVTVTWVAPANNGSAILSYAVSTYAGGTLVAGKSCSPNPATGLTCDVTGLTNGTAYTFKVKATNGVGPSADSTASLAATPATVPAAPAAPSVVKGDAKVTVTWVAPANNGSTILSYVVSTYAGGTLVAGKGCSPNPATGLTCDVIGLTNGTAYTFKVTATNEVGPSADSSASLAATPSTVPAAPAAPTVTRGDSKVTVTWVAPVNNGSAILGYTITTYAGGSVVAGKTCTPSPVTGVTCDVTGLTNGTAYTFKVKATNEVGPSADSTASLAATPSTVPAAPAAPSVVKGDAKVTVTWVAPANNGSTILSYAVSTYAGGTLVEGKACSPTPATGLTCDVTGLTNGTAYTFKVKATNEVGPSADSTASLAATPSTVPAAPAAPTVTRGDSKVTVTWVAPANGGSAILGYTITTYAAGSVVAGKTCTPSPVTGVTCDVTGLTNGTAYTFTVKATNGVGPGPDSVASAAVTPATTPAAPAAPSVVKGDAKVTVTWVAPANNGSAILSYVVSTYAAGTLVAGKGCSPTPATGLTCDVTGLTNGTAYTFKVKATNEVGPSADSAASAAATPLGAPASAAAPTVTRGDSKVTVTWVAPANNGSAITGYTVSTYAGGTLVAGKSCTPTPVTGLTCDVTGLTNGTAYTFKVKATNLIGSSDSAESAAVTPATTPTAPAAPSVVKGDAKVTVTWVAPANGGSAILSYTVTTYAGGTLVAGKGCSPTPATGLTCDVTGLTNGTAYTFKVKATNDVGPSADSAASAVATPLGAPASAAAPTVTRGNAQVTVTWVAPATNGSAITGYTVATYAAGTLVTGKACTPSPVTALTCTVTGLTNGTEYTFKVTATNAIGSTDSAASAAVTPATAPTAPAAPTVVKGNLSVQVTWVAPANGGSAITGYTVSTYTGTTLVTGKTCTPSPATATTCVVTGLTNGTAYTFKVKATNAVNSSADSAASAAVTPAAVPATPAAPTLKVGSTVGSGKATVTWVAPANNGSAITGFTATAYTAAGVSSGTCTTASATALTCSITGLTNGTAYTFKVTAKNANGTSFESPGATATPSATAVAGVAGTVPATPAAPTVKVGGTVAARTAAISWVAPANGGSAITGYTVTASTSTGAVAGTCTASGTAVTCSIASLTTGTTYTFTVVATNAVGNSTASPGTTGIPT